MHSKGTTSAMRHRIIYRNNLRFFVKHGAFPCVSVCAVKLFLASYVSPSVDGGGLRRAACIDLVRRS